MQTKKLTKAQRHALEKKNAKRKKVITISVCVLIAAIITAIIIYSVTRPEIGSRVYTAGPQTVTLYDDGRFSFIDCSFVRTGRFTEIARGDDIAVEFVHRNVTVYGSISGNILTIPNEWDSGKGHDPQLRLQQGR
jgi:hypothetical protein